MDTSTLRCSIGKVFMYYRYCLDLLSIFEHEVYRNIPILTNKSTITVIVTYWNCFRYCFSVDVIKTLVKNSQHSLRWDSLTHLSETPLFLACQFHRPFEIVKYIVDLDKNVVSAATFELVTPLHKAAESIDSKVAEYLIINGADINAINNVGYTPLMDAIRGEFWETVYCLLTYGADVSIHGADNMNALTIAVSRNYNKDHIKTLVLFTNGNEGG